MKAFASSVLYVFSIVLAVGIGMFQVGKEVHIGNSSEGGDSDCSFDGYSVYGCISDPLTAGCKSGWFEYAEFGSEGTSEYKPKRGLFGRVKYVRLGNCLGDNRCKTPKTTDLTSSGCGS